MQTDSTVHERKSCMSQFGAVSSGTGGQSKKELGLKTRLSFFYVKLRYFNKI
nr:MAG TPA: hypothetical protein [Caudoviricetes sp.]